jgi:hypothetical protein
MGTWGVGNFENDTAAEHLIGLCKSLIEQIRNAFRDPRLMRPGEHDSDIFVANIEILAVLGENIGRTKKEIVGDLVFPFPFPSVKEIQDWMDEYLKAWDSDIGKLAGPSYVTRRRPVIVQTFDRLIAVAEAGPPIKE